jgi:hypothetical protein
VHLGQVVAQRHLGLARSASSSVSARDVRVAVAVAADPVAHAQEEGDLVAGSARSIAVQARDLRRKVAW